MAISSCTSAATQFSLQSAANSNDPIQQQIGTQLLKTSLEQAGQSALTLIQAATTVTAEPGSLGATVNIRA
jgi:Putative motility protein